MTCCRLSSASMIWPSWVVRGKSRPAYRYPSAQNSTRGASWLNRSITPRQPKSGEQLDQMAPMLVVASIAMTACGMFGRQDATRSPGRTPSSRSRVASTRTWPARVSQGSPASGVCSLR